MPKPAPALTLSLDRARAAMAASQGLAAAGDGDPTRLVPTIEETGFVRTLGGVDVYLAVRARVPGMARADLDGAVAARTLQVVPAVRGCIYLVPRRDVGLALKVADLLSRSRADREHERAGIRGGELEAVGEAVLALLAEAGALTTDALRRDLPEGTVRSLGEAGKKVGISSTLPPALRRLEFAGGIERLQEGGRLDTERYLWRLPEVDPFAGASLPEDPIELFARCAEVFFRAAGLGTVKDLACWTGVSQRDAKAALARVAALPVAVEGEEELYFALEEARERLEGGEGEDPPAVALLPFEDNLIALHRGPALLVDPAHHGVEVPVWGSSTKSAALGEARHMSFRSVVAGGRILGLWEYDPDARAAVVACFAPVAKATRERIEEAAAGTARFLAEEIGHGRSFSLDTDDELRRRAAQLREMGGRLA